MIDNLIDGQHGTAVLLATIALALCLNILVKVGEFVYTIFKTKSESTETAMNKLIESLGQNTTSLNALVGRMDILEKDLNEVVKYKADIRKLFTAIKTLAGDSWSEIRKSIIEDDIAS